MVYHSSFGEPQLAFDLARRLIVHVKQHCPPMVVVKYLRNAAHALRCNDPQEALSTAISAFQMASHINAPNSRAACAGMIASINMQIGDNELAAEWLSRRDACECDPCRTQYGCKPLELPSRISHPHAGCWICRICGKALLPGNIKNRLHGTSVRICALEVQLDVLRKEPIHVSRLDLLMGYFEKTKLSSLQDYSAESLLLAFRAANRVREASLLAYYYLSECRRDLSPVSTPLRRLIDSLEARPE